MASRVGDAIRLVGSGAAGMPPRRRRRIDATVLAIAAIVVGTVAAAGVALGRSERITRLWVGAEIERDGGARVTEVVDYDFGSRRRHGIFREVRGLDRDAGVTVSSDSAPDQVALLTAGQFVRIRVGDPTRTVSGTHRYRIQYHVDGLVHDERLRWATVGSGWSVDVGALEFHAVAPFVFADVGCELSRGLDTRCDIAQPATGRLEGRTGAIPQRQDVDVVATTTRYLGDTRRLPAPPSVAVADAGGGPVVVGLLAVVAALAAMAVTSAVLRSAGRERVGPVEAGPSAGADTSEVRVDAADLAAHADVTPSPPAELTPAQGGVLLAEGVRREHKVAWLLTAAADGYVDVDSDGKPVTLRPRESPSADQPTAARIDRLFGRRSKLILAAYDPAFASLWNTLDEELCAWEVSADVWDPVGDRRRAGSRAFALIATPLGLLMAGFGGNLAAWSPGVWELAVLAGAAVAGAGLAALFRGWELRIRTPAGSALWLRVEGFRRFLAKAGTGYVDEVAGAGQLAHFTAWAVALGVHDHWAQTMAGANAAEALGFPLCTSAFVDALEQATTAAVTEPSVSVGSAHSSSDTDHHHSFGGGSGGGGGSW